MKIDIFGVTRAEIEIMDVLWNASTAQTAGEISAKLKQACGKSVKPQTIHTLCGRLYKKGLAACVMGGGVNLYMPLIMRDVYRFVVAKLLISELFEGGVTELVEVLLGDCDMSREMLNSLKALVAGAGLAADEWESEATGTEDEANGQTHSCAAIRMRAEPNAVKMAARVIRQAHAKRRERRIPRAG